MKIIDIGICRDNKDPRGFGRIRASQPNELDSTRANAIPTWDRWTSNDPFVYSPFLPNHINIIPKEGQAVKIIRYDDDKSLQNQEYIPGPYTTPHNFGYQNDLTQTTETSIGQRGVKTPAIKSFTGDLKVYDDGFLRPESVGSLPKIDDVALSGNYGSDIILSEHGVQLRAGKLIDKTNAPEKQKSDLELYPMYSRKHSKLSLKKFPETYVLGKDTIEESIIPRADLNYIFEYDVDNLSSPTNVTLYLYKVIRSEGEKYKTDVFNINTEISLQSVKLEYQLTVNLETSGTQNKLQEAYVMIRDFISKLDRQKLSTIDPSISGDYAHPFYFRPKATLRTQSTSNNFLTNVVYSNKTNGFGLVYSLTSIDAQPVPRKVDVPVLKKVNSADQTFAALTADHILQLSTVTTGPDGKQIDFGALDKYEYTQEDYLMKIIPNTFSSVRGEKLIEILELITLILLNHTHGIITPPLYFESEMEKLRKLISRAKQDMVNDSIRIN